jgi:hypothetical protein
VHDSPRTFWKSPIPAEPDHDDADADFDYIPSEFQESSGKADASHATVAGTGLGWLRGQVLSFPPCEALF